MSFTDEEREAVVSFRIIKSNDTLEEAKGIVSKEGGRLYSNLNTFTGLSDNVPYKIRVKDSNGCLSPVIPWFNCE
jgi:hypothetical protein